MPGCHCGTRLRRRLRNRNLRNGWAKSLLELKKEKDAVKAFVLVRTENANHLRLDRWIRQNPTVQKIHRTRGYYQFVVETKYSDQREFEKWVLNLQGSHKLKTCGHEKAVHARIYFKKPNGLGSVLKTACQSKKFQCRKSPKPIRHKNTKKEKAWDPSKPLSTRTTK